MREMVLSRALHDSRSCIWHDRLIKSCREAIEMNYTELNSFIEEEPSGFFDDATKKERYAKMKASLSEKEMEEIEAVKEDMANLPPPPDPEENEAVDSAEPPDEAPPRNLVGDFIDSNCSYQEYRESLTAEEVIDFEEEWSMMQNIPVVDPERRYCDDDGNYHEEHEIECIIPERMLPYKSVPNKSVLNMPGSKETESAIIVTEVEEIMKVGAFLFKNGYLYFMIDEEHGVIIANFFIEVIKEKIAVTEEVNEQNEVTGYNESTTWEVKIFCLGEIFEAEVTIASLYSEKEILKITKDRGFIEQTKEAKDLIKRYLNEIIKYRNCPTIFEFSATGWTKNIDGKWHYLTDVGVIGHPEINARANVPQHFIYDSNRVGSKSVFEEFLGLRNICPQKPEYSTFLMHYTCLSVLTTLFQEVGHGINFVVALIGPTNSRKTSSALVFSRIFDRTPKAAADIRFDSTDVAIREKMESYGDAILLVDDFLPYEDKSAIKNQIRKSEILVRGYGDRVPRKRSKAYAQINGIEAFNRVKGCCMITGEVFEANSESSLTRVIQIPFELGDVDLALLSFYQNNLLNIPSFIFDFICFIETNVENVFESIKKEIDKARMDKNLKIRTPRFRDTMGILKAEISIFYNYAKARGFMTEAEIIEAMACDEKLIRKLIDENDSDTKVKSPATIICAALKKAISSNRLQIVSEEEAKSMIDFEWAVIENDEYLMILSNTLQNVYSMYCREKGREVIYKSGREIANPLSKENAIFQKNESGKPRRTHKINAKTEKRFLFIKKSKFVEFCNIFDEF